MLRVDDADRRKPDIVVIKDIQTGESNSSCDNTYGSSGAGEYKDSRKEKNLVDLCQTCLGGIFRKKTLYKRLPICQWLPKYSKTNALGDMIAGITVGLLIVPQGLAYAAVAGLPSQFGLYGAFFGSFIYVLLGTCKDNTIGSTAIASVMVFQVANGIWQRAVLLTFLTGIIEIAMALFRLSFLVDFVSRPVTAGFSSAAACIVLTSQVKDILGVNGSGSTFLQRWITMFGDMRNARLPDTLLGLICIVFLLIGRYISRLRFGVRGHAKTPSKYAVLNGALWFVGTIRNALLVIVCALIIRYLDARGKNPFKLTGFIPPGLPPFQLPSFSISSKTANPAGGFTEQISETFSDMVRNMGLGMVVIPLIALVENNSVCKVFAKGNPIDPTQELLAIGLANVANSFVSGYRSNGGLTRASISNASGARTPLTNLYIGLVVVLALLFLTDFFYYIPKAVLAAVIVSAVIFQIQFQLVPLVWRSSRSDLIPGLLAFFACLVMRLEVGVFAAIGVNLLFLLYYSARPKIVAEMKQTCQGQRYLKLTPDRGLCFPSADFVHNVIAKEGTRAGLPVLLDCSHLSYVDFTAARALADIVTVFEMRHQRIMFMNVKPRVMEILQIIKSNLIVCYDEIDLNVKISNGDGAINNNSN